MGSGTNSRVREIEPDPIQVDNNVVWWLLFQKYTLTQKTMILDFFNIFTEKNPHACNSTAAAIFQENERHRMSLIAQMKTKIVLTGVRAFGPLAVFFVFSYLFVSFFVASGASLSQLQDTLSNPIVSVASNHTITFRATSGVTAGTVVVNLGNTVSSIGSVDSTDIDLEYGGVSQTLAAVAGANTWGTAISAEGVITFTYPTSCTAPCAAISAGATVTVRVGTNASGGDAQMTNTGSAGSRLVSIKTANDSGLFAVAILSNPQVSISGSASVPAGSVAVPAPTPTPTISPTIEAKALSETVSAPIVKTIEPIAPAPVHETKPETVLKPEPEKAPTPTLTAEPPKQTTPAPQTETEAAPSPTKEEIQKSSQTTVPELPLLPHVEKTLSASNGISLPAVSAGGGPIFLGVTNPDGSGVSASLGNVAFVSQRGTVVPVRIDVIPMPGRDAAAWTGCSNINELPIVGGTAYGFSAVNTQPKNAGDASANASSPIQFTLTYSDEDLKNQGINESSIRPFAFDPENCFQIIPTFSIDAEKNTVKVTVTPKTFFALIGDLIPGFQRREVVAISSDGPKPELSGIGQNDLNIPVASAENTRIDMCLKSSLFKKSVKSISLSIAGERHRLVYDDARDCFAASLALPAQRGQQEIELKIIYVDDQVQVIRFKALVTSNFQATLLNFTLPLLQQIQAINKEVGKAIEQTQPILQTTAAAAVPVVGVANPSLVTNALNWYYYLNHFFSWLLSLLGLRKKRKPWGIAYNAITKTPIDLVIVRLFEKATKRLIETQVTDKNGRFSFLAPPGEYTITATKNPFVFPSALIKGTIDGDFSDIYREEQFTITSPDQPMHFSIPLDPPKVEHAVVVGRVNIVKRWKTFVGHNPLAPLLAGFLLAEILTLYIPNTLNYTLLGLNGFFVLTQLVLGVRTEKAWGLVFDAASLEPVPLAAITLFDAKEGKMLRTRLSDYFGRFSFLTPTGQYMLAVTKEGYAFPAAREMRIKKYRHLYFGEPFSVKGRRAVVKSNIPIVPKMPEAEIIEHVSIEPESFEPESSKPEILIPHSPTQQSEKEPEPIPVQEITSSEEPSKEETHIEEKNVQEPEAQSAEKSLSGQANEELSAVQQEQPHTSQQTDGTPTIDKSVSA